MAVFTLTLVRHAETNCNKESIMQGQKDTTLSEKGLRQADLAGQRLQYEQFSHVFSSDLQRARKTCEIILHRNKLTPSRIRQDARLRERKFGIFEGCHRSDYVAEAKRQRKSMSAFVPEGGESAADVRSRAAAFFSELCAEVRLLLDRDNNCLESGTPLTRNTAASSPSDTVFNEDNADRSSSSSGSSTSGCSSLNASAEHLSADNLSAEHLGTEQLSSEQAGNLSSVQHRGRDLEDNIAWPGHQAMFDLEIKTNIAAPKASPHACPNVSLSPLFEHRLSSLSSMSSGRNSSFDDGDSIPQLVADILVVTHGGLLKEMVGYFVDALGCKLPGGIRHAQQVSPNTGISKFTVSVGEPPRLTCLSLHDRDHLSGLDAEPLSQNEEA